MKLSKALKKTSNSKVACRKLWKLNDAILKPVLINTPKGLITGKIMFDKNVEIGSKDFEADDWEVINVP
ncbi:hypothetical protein [Limosilactobacillus agrestimuris]|uniref:hypothetical protein n=1 Tax=Limosilactobacillus agrestimuris TaxID=2941331 RepID=UPI00203F6596|nr:hypothetical protein [Limosilactobacillus agrestimuris]